MTSAKRRTSANSDFQVRWLESALERKILTASEVTEALLEATKGDQDLVEAIRARYDSEPERLSQLEILLEELASLETELPVGPDSALDVGRQAFDPPEDTEQTQAAGRRTKAPKTQDPKSNGSQSNGTKSNLRALRPALNSSGNDDVTIGKQGSSSGSRKSHNRNGSRRLSSGVAPGSAAGPISNALDSRRAELLAELESASARYRVTEEVGRGGCGVVTKAYDAHLQRDVVLKQIIDNYATNDEIVQRFINEARITGQLEHPGIVPVHELSIGPDAMPFYSMKEVRGETLSVRIKSLHASENAGTQRQALRQLLDRFLSVCQTMAFAHKAQVIHRDLKPANIMIGEFGETIVLDWGLARRLEPQHAGPENAESENKASEEDDRTRASGQMNTPAEPSSGRGSGLRKGVVEDTDMTRQGTVLGTATYMSPEQAMGLNDRVDSRSDVFSLGIILYEILSGESPFKSDTLQTTIERVAECKYRPVRECSRSIPRPLAAICTKAMQKDRHDRYETAKQLASDLEEYLSGGTVSVYKEKMWEKFDRTANNHRGLFRTVFSASIMIAVVAILAVSQVMKANRHEHWARLEAIASKDRAELALTYEQAARQRVSEQLAVSRDAADNWLLDLSGELQFYPGLEPMRRSLIQQAQEHYASVALAAKQDLAALSGEERLRDAGSLEISALESLQTEVAGCELRLGDLQRLAGNLDAATKHYKTASNLFEELVNEAHLDSAPRLDFAIQVANAQIGIALASADNELGLALVNEARISLSDLLSQRPEHVQTRNALARAHLVSSRLHAASDHADQALNSITSALTNTDILLQQDPSQRHRKLRGTILEDQARLLFRFGRPDEAEKVARKLVDHYDDSLADGFSRPDIVESRSNAFSLLGSSLLSNGDTRGSLRSYASASADLDAAWDMLYGENFYRENRSILALNIATAARLQNDFPSAEAACREAINETRWLIETDGISRARIEMMARTYHALIETMLHRIALDDQQVEELRQLVEQGQVLTEHLADQLRNSEANCTPAAEAAQEARENAQAFLEYRLAARLTDREGAVQRSNAELAAMYESLVVELDGDTNLAETQLASITLSRLQGRSEAESQDAKSTLQSSLTSLESTVLEGLVDRLLEATEDRDVSVAEHAYSMALQILYFGNDIGLDEDLQRGLRIALKWTQEHENSYRAWHWYSVGCVLADKPVEAKQALNRAIDLGADKTTIEDELLSCVVSEMLNEPTARMRRLELENLKQSAGFSAEHRRFLELLVERTFNDSSDQD